MNYLNIIKGSGFITRPIDYSNEIHSFMYMYNNNIIDTSVHFDNSYRILSSSNNIYGVIYNVESENIYHLTQIFSHGFLVIYSDLINSNISKNTYFSVINYRKTLNNQIINTKISTDMIKITSMIISKCTNTIFFWI